MYVCARTGLSSERGMQRAGARERAQMYIRACTWAAVGSVDVADAWRVLGQQIVSE